MTAMVETINLAKHFGSIKAVDDLSFSVAKGEVLGFLGPNGAGKSTTMKILTCFLSPDGGTGRVCGHDIQKDSMAVRRAIGYLPETAPAYSEMTVLGFLKYIGQMRGLGGSELKTALDTVIGKCHLEGVLHQTFETLSKGYKRRTCMAQALIHDPPVLVMDEPTDGLDPNQKHEVRKLIAGMAKDKCIILSTHILEEVEAVCTRAIVINRGRLVADLTPEEMRGKSPRHGAVLLGLKDVDLQIATAAINSLEYVKKVETVIHGDKPALTVFPKPGEKIAARMTEFVNRNNWSVEEFHVETGQMDEVFRELTRNGGPQA